MVLKEVCVVKELFKISIGKIKKNDLCDFDDEGLF